MDDFGFTFEDESDLDSTLAQAEDIRLQYMATVDTLKKVVEERDAAAKSLFLYNAKVMTFLNNLKKDPDKATIKWPNRAEAIEKFITELEALTK